MTGVRLFVPDPLTSQLFASLQSYTRSGCEDGVKHGPLRRWLDARVDAQVIIMIIIFLACGAEDPTQTVMEFPVYVMPYCHRIVLNIQASQSSGFHVPVHYGRY